MNYHQLTERERYQIEFMLQRGRTKAEIAKELKRHRSTIYREIARHSLELLNEGIVYDAIPAQGMAEASRREACEARYKVRGELKEYFEQKLEYQWSPEQIAGRYNLQCGQKVIGKSSIYRFIAKDYADCFGEGYFTKLRFYNPKRRKKVRYARKPRGERRSIRERSTTCEERKECGHFERDLMEGVRGKKAVLVIADRKSRKVFLRMVNRASSVVHAATITSLAQETKRSVTNDNGYEFVPRDLFEAEATLGSKIYYCDPHSPWQRGTVENTIGLLRQYLPKRKDLSRVTPRKLKEIEDLLNNRPRKILNFKTPSEMYFEETKEKDLHSAS
jgi:IS30 family transposase